MEMPKERCDFSKLNAILEICSSLELSWFALQHVLMLKYTLSLNGCGMVQASHGLNPGALAR
eukprot:1906506-Amphidinium_carterae.1